MSNQDQHPAEPAMAALLDPQSPDYLKDPYLVFRNARRTCPVARVGNSDEFVVTGRQQIIEVLRDPIRFTSRYNLDGLQHFGDTAYSLLERSLFFRVAKFNVDPPGHADFRAFLSQFISPRRLRNMEPAIYDLARRLVAEFRDLREADLLSQYAYPLPMGVIADLIGLPDADRPMVKDWNNAWLALQVVPMTADQQVQCAHAVLAYEQYLRDLLAERSRTPADDLLTEFAVAAAAGRVCTLEDAIVAVRVMIAAGHETTTNLIANALFHLLWEPSRWHALVTEPTVAAAAVEEALRFDPSVQAAPRTTTEDVELAGVKISAGARVHCMFAATGRDPGWVDDPDEFRLDRTGPPRHLGFGFGIHFCVGAQLARLQSRAALTALAESLPDLALRPGFEPVHIPGGFVFRGLSQLAAVWSVPTLPGPAASGPARPPRD